jgi:hypothetical protein
MKRILAPNVWISQPQMPKSLLIITFSSHTPDTKRYHTTTRRQWWKETEKPAATLPLFLHPALLLFSLVFLSVVCVKMCLCAVGGVSVPTELDCDSPSSLYDVLSGGPHSALDSLAQRQQSPTPDLFNSQDGCQKDAEHMDKMAGS